MGEGSGGSRSKANARQNSKNKAYYERQFFRTEKNKARNIAKQERVHERHLQHIT
jgi:hypothetical protein